MARALRQAGSHLRRARRDIDAALRSLRDHHTAENSAVKAIIRLNRARDCIRKANRRYARKLVLCTSIANRIHRGHTKWVLIRSFCFRTLTWVSEVKEVSANDVCHEIAGARDQDRSAYALWRGSRFRHVSYVAVD